MPFQVEKAEKQGTPQRVKASKRDALAAPGLNFRAFCGRQRLLSPNVQSMSSSLPDELLRTLQQSFPCRELQVRQIASLLGVG